MQKLSIVAGLVACASLIVGGCGSESSEPATAAPADTATESVTESSADMPTETGAAGEIIMASNENCPKTGRPVSTAVETVEYDGKQIGFCCAGCKASWANMSDDGRAALISKQG